MLTTFARIAKILKGLVEPRNWVEEAFSDISGGGGGGVLIVHVDENGTLDKTWKEIKDAGVSFASAEVPGPTPESVEWRYSPLSSISYTPAHGGHPSEYTINFNGAVFITENENGYPVSQ